MPEGLEHVARLLGYLSFFEELFGWPESDPESEESKTARETLDLLSGVVNKQAEVLAKAYAGDIAAEVYTALAKSTALTMDLYELTEEDDALEEALAALIKMSTDMEIERQNHVTAPN